MGLLGSFNDEEGKVSSSAGKYRVMQVVLREKFVGKGSKNFSEIEDICNQQYAEGYRLHTFAQSRDLVAAIVQSATWYLRKWSRSKT